MKVPYASTLDGALNFRPRRGTADTTIKNMNTGDYGYMPNKRKLGEQYEQMVAIHLRRQGYLIKERNWRCKFGEVDIIAVKDNYLVFIEVKFRSKQTYGSPAEAVDYHKQRRISNVSSCYLYKKHYPIDTPVRYDVAAVTEDGIEIVENAFTYCGSFMA